MAGEHVKIVSERLGHSTTRLTLDRQTCKNIQSAGFRTALDAGRTLDRLLVNKGDVGNIWTQPLEGGTPKQITNFTSENIWSFDFSRDGKQLAVARGTTISDVVLISGIRK